MDRKDNETDSRLTEEDYARIQKFTSLPRYRRSADMLVPDGD